MITYQEIYNIHSNGVNGKCLENLYKYLTHDIIDNKKIIIINDELIIKDQKIKNRKKYHELCESFNLIHFTDFNGILHISKPPNWNFNCIKLEPYISPKDIKRKEKLSSLECYNCNKNGNEITLYSNCFKGGLYCDNCIETCYDEYSGDPFNAYKWEPLNEYH